MEVLDLDLPIFELGADRTAPNWLVPPIPGSPQKAIKQRSKPRRNRQRTRRLDLLMDSDRVELPPHLLRYGRQQRNHGEYSGPSLLAAESDEGCVEYKLRLATTNYSRFQQLVTQLKFRLSEGGGECYYYIGVEDNGHPRGLEEAELQTSLAALVAMASEVGAAATVVQTPDGTEGRRCAVVRIRGISLSGAAHEDLRVAVAGGVDSGKSTLVSVLSHGADGRAALDNGRGSARMNVFRHKHEIESGRTSSISHQLVGYGADGSVLNYGHKEVSAFTPRELAQAAARVARFSDLGGHEKFSKTSLYGMTCTLPDYVMLCVCASTGLSGATLGHLAVALALGVPSFVVLTKVDLAGEGRVEALAAEVAELVAGARSRADVAPGGRGEGAAAAADELAPVVQSEAQAAALAAALGRQRASGGGRPGDIVVPVFAASSVTGASLSLLHAFLSVLPPSEAPDDGGRDEAAAGVPSHSQRQPHSEPSAAAPVSHFQIDNTFEVAGVGSVVSGTMLCGRIEVGARLLLGPSDDGAFSGVRVTGIQRSQVDVDSVHKGQHATLAIEPEPSAREPGSGGAAGVAHPATPTAVSTPPPLLLEPALPGVSGDAAGSPQPSSSSEGGSPRPGSPLAEAAAGGACSSRGERGSGLEAAAEGRAPSPPRASTAVDICHPSKHKWRASEADLALLGRSWEFAQRLHPSGLAAPAAAPGPRPRKGTVLVDLAANPRPVMEFDAVIVLLGGSWPPRGVLSRRFPPDDGSDAPAPRPHPGSAPFGSSPAGSGSESGSAGRSGGSAVRLADLPRSRSGRLASYTPVVHCGGVRQAAQVVSMCEVGAPWGQPGASAQATGSGSGRQTAAGLRCAAEASGEGSTADGMCDEAAIVSGLAAAGVLATWVPGGGSSPVAESAGAGGLQRTLSGAAASALGDVGCVCRARFRFTHRPEWILPGTRLILRDRASGRVAGGGVVAEPSQDCAPPAVCSP